jgi:hypothetical protein
MFASMSSKLQLKTVADVIDAFGGVRGMCAIFGGVPSRFGNYKMKGCFPDHMHMRIYRAACKRGLNIDDKLLGAEEPERQGQLALQAAE